MSVTQSVRALPTELVKQVIRLHSGLKKSLRDYAYVLFIVWNDLVIILARRRFFSFFFLSMVTRVVVFYGRILFRGVITLDAIRGYERNAE